MNCEQINYKYLLPKNFDANIAEFDIFKNLPAEKCREMEVKSFKNIRIANNSVLFNYFNIIKESCIGSNIFEKYQKGYKFFLKFIFSELNFNGLKNSDYNDISMVVDLEKLEKNLKLMLKND